jgi:triacylglycerol lipase
MNIFYLATLFIPTALGASPTVTISSSATVIGSASSSLESFIGIPFAQPPVDSLRLKPPKPLESPLGVFNATGSARACPQFYFQVDPGNFPTGVLGELIDTPLFQNITDSGEDCLTLDVIRPAGIDASAKLPVLFWIFGGAFELGSSSSYNGSLLVSDSITKEKPFIFVAVNYRVGGFGFLAGKELLADNSTNLGLLDQRLGLEWVADNIAAFGGDPAKVTIFGESAGSISIFNHMALYDGDNAYKGQPLFRAGIMDSGSLQPAQAADSAIAQGTYDTVVAKAGCESAEDTLECLREVDYTTLLNAVNSVPGIIGYQSIALQYLPRPDGTVLTESPDILAKQGKFAKVPFIIGDQKDEGTLFALFTYNVTTSEDVRDYLSNVYFPDAPQSVIDGLMDLYPDNPVDGSPYDTGLLNNWYPQYKRLASIFGDIAFTLTRRAFLSAANATHPDVPSWSYLSSYYDGTAIMGNYHGSDLLLLFEGSGSKAVLDNIESYYFSFIYNLDPNNGSGLQTWPQWKDDQELLQFEKGGLLGLLADNFREDAYNFIDANSAYLRA